MEDLQILQNKAAKVILDLPSNASSTDAPKTLLAGQHYSNSALYIDTLPPLSTFTGLWIIASTFKEILTSIIIIRKERTISAFLMFKETMENKDFYTYVQKNGIFKVLLLKKSTLSSFLSKDN